MIGLFHALVFLCARAGEEPAPAEPVFRGGAVYTVDAARAWASAVAVREGRIVYVGSDDGLEPFIGPQTRVIELAGRMLLPGFQDSHIHPGGGIGLAKLRLYGLRNRQEVLERIREYAATHPELEWIDGAGWEVAAFKPSGVPHRRMLDQVVPDRPAFLRASDGHTGWANSRALALAGITAETPDPPNGRIGRDPESGEPDGVLYEAAQTLVSQHVPPITPEERLAGYRLFLNELRRHGITAFVDAGAAPEADRTFAQLAAAGELNAHAVLCMSFDPDRSDDEQVEKFLARRRALAGPGLRANCVKLMLDGIIEQHTGSLLEPYLDQEGDRGPLFIGGARLERLVTRLDREGFQIHVHAIGDRAVREALDAFEAARRANGPRDARLPSRGQARHSVAHVQLINPADIPRLRRLGVAANMTPLWGHGDDWNLVFAEPRLGPERSRWLYSHATILATGGRLVWGTDWPVTTLAPLDGIEAAVTRRGLGGRDPEGRSDTAWIPDERIRLDEALAAYTINGAWLVSEEAERGSIEVGKRADLVVLEKNLFEVDPLDIHRVRVDLTVFGGRIVYDRAAAPPQP